MDQEGREHRRAQSLERRNILYFLSGPNHTWHVDGYDKLIPYGFPVHGRIDGWSQKMCLTVTSQTTIQELLLISIWTMWQSYEAVQWNWGLTVEQKRAWWQQCNVQYFNWEDEEVNKYGSSPSNQRIESCWGFYRRNKSGWWINFNSLKWNRKSFEIQMTCLWFCFAQLLQDWRWPTQSQRTLNTHLIRGSRHDTISLWENGWTIVSPRAS